jgi:hypothetical protein
MRPDWTILIATLGRRNACLERLLAILMPQVEAAQGRVTVLALRNHGGDVARFRNQLVEAAPGRYISFVDDDDMVPEYFVREVLPLLDGVDYIGWRMQAFQDGMRLVPTYHSLAFGEWRQDGSGFYRDVSHLNPVRRELTEGCTFSGRQEDREWAAQLRPRLRTEHVIDREMYQYYWVTSDSVTSDTARQHGGGPDQLPDVPLGPYFSWHPASILCAP